MSCFNPSNTDLLRSVRVARMHTAVSSLFKSSASARSVCPQPVKREQTSKVTATHKNAAFRKNYDKLKAENPHNLYYVTSDGLDGVEDDRTVDGIHLTDLGFRHYADKMIPILGGILYSKDKK